MWVSVVADKSGTVRRTVFHFTDTTGFGGAEQAALTLMAGLERQGWRSVLVHHPSPGVAPLLEKAQQLNVELLPVPSMPDGLQGARRVPWFVQVLRNQKPDVFHAHLTWPLACKFGLVSALAAQVPAVVATVQLFLDFHLDASIYTQHRLIAAKMGRYIAVSRDIARKLSRTMHWSPDKISVVHNGIDQAPFTGRMNCELRDTLNAMDDKPLVLTVARLDEQKGHCYLLQAAAQVPEARFVLAGDGPERTSLEAQAQELGLGNRVVFLGYRSDIWDLLSCCDLFVLPSLYEGLPLSVLEAMAAGKPVIATSVGGTDEAVIPGETGLFVPPADPASLAYAIRCLLGDPALAGRLASAGRDRVRLEFSAERMVRQVTQVYDELLARREAPHGPSRG